MSYEIKSNRGPQCDKRQEQWPQLAHSRGGKRLMSSGFLKALEVDTRTIRDRSTIGIRGVGSTHTSTMIDIEAFDLGMVNTSAVSPRDGGRPGAHRELFRLDRKSPTRIHGNHIGPTDGELFKRVCDDYSLIAEENFGAYQEDVNTNENKERHEEARYLGGGSALVETRPNKETAERHSNASEEQVSSRAVGTLIIHLTILSHLSADSIKAVS